MFVCFLYYMRKIWNNLRNVCSFSRCLYQKSVFNFYVWDEFPNLFSILLATSLIINRNVESSSISRLIVYYLLIVCLKKSLRMSKMKIWNVNSFHTRKQHAQMCKFQSWSISVQTRQWRKITSVRHQHFFKYKNLMRHPSFHSFIWILSRNKPVLQIETWWKFY